MKKNSISLIIFLIVLSCSKKSQNEVNDTTFLNENYFSVSENNRKLDSLDHIPLPSNREELYVRKDQYFNEDYYLGAIHFLIVNKQQSFYFINYLKDEITCGVISPMRVQDSIAFVERSISKLKKIKPIKTTEINKILSRYKKQIYNDGRLLQVSFALKNDTLKGNTMFTILNFMEENELKSYTIRQMNPHEIKATEKRNAVPLETN